STPPRRPGPPACSARASCPGSLRASRRARRFARRSTPMPTGPRSRPIPSCASPPGVTGACLWQGSGSARRHLRELRRVVADLVPARLVGHLLVEAGAKVEVLPQAGGHEVDGAEVVVEAGSAVAAEVPRGQVALVGLHQVLALGEPEALLRHHHTGRARTG